MSHVLSAQPPTTKGPEVHPKATDPKTEHPPREHRAPVHSSSSSLQSSDGRIIKFKYECNLCPGNKHPLFQCPKFNGFTVAQKGEHIRTFKLCYNCLAPGHRNTECRSFARCKSGAGRHHTLVHRDQGMPTLMVNVLAASTNARSPKLYQPV